MAISPLLILAPFAFARQQDIALLLRFAVLAAALVLMFLGIARFGTTRPRILFAFFFLGVPLLVCGRVMSSSLDGLATVGCLSIVTGGNVLGFALAARIRAKAAATHREVMPSDEDDGAL